MEDERNQCRKALATSVTLNFYFPYKCYLLLFIELLDKKCYSFLFTLLYSNVCETSEIAKLQKNQKKASDL